MSAAKFLGISAGLGAVGYGGYFLSQSKFVSKFEQDEKAAAKLVESESKKVNNLGKAITEHEAKRASLTKEHEGNVKAAQAAEAELEAARKQLEKLEKEYATKQAAIAKVTKELHSVTSKIGSMKQDVERAAEAVTLGERSLKIARQQAAEARKLYNPLNHPKVLALLGGKGK